MIPIVVLWCDFWQEQPRRDMRPMERSVGMFRCLFDPSQHNLPRVMVDPGIDFKDKRAGPAYKDTTQASHGVELEVQMLVRMRFYAIPRRGD